MLLIDDETESYWDHITGEAVHGPLKGTRLESWCVEFATVATALAERPALRISRPKQSLTGRLMGLMHRKQLGRDGFIPPPFRITMKKVDPRLPELMQGVGVWDDERARFYPMNALSSPVTEPWGEREIHVAKNADGIPVATFADGERPLQMFSRWYGFAATFAHTEVGPLT